MKAMLTGDDIWRLAMSLESNSYFNEGRELLISVNQIPSISNSFNVTYKNHWPHRYTALTTLLSDLPTIVNLPDETARLIVIWRMQNNK